MKVGFTGTREGMTLRQREEVGRLLSNLYPTEAHHGDCIGADEQFHDLAFQSNGERVKRVGHPPERETYRAFCECDESRAPKSYLKRNREIVDETDVLIAAPKAADQPLMLKGQGTWSTIYYALSRRKKVYLVAPDGTVGDPPPRFMGW